MTILAKKFKQQEQELAVAWMDRRLPCLIESHHSQDHLVRRQHRSGFDLEAAEVAGLEMAVMESVMMEIQIEMISCQH